MTRLLPTTPVGTWLPIMELPMHMMRRTGWTSVTNAGVTSTFKYDGLNRKISQKVGAGYAHL